jgi:hypothetical protein
MPFLQRLTLHRAGFCPNQFCPNQKKPAPFRLPAINAIQSERGGFASLPAPNMDIYTKACHTV